MNRTDEIDLPADWEDDSAPDPTSKRRGRVALIALLVALALVIAVGVVVGGYLNSLRTSANQITTVEITRGASDGERPVAEEGTGHNYLLLGSDKRSEEEDDSQVTGQRSDVMMLVHVNDDATEVYVMSFPRDLWVEIPGHGEGRINAALAYGGLPLAVTTVENYTGVPIDHVALIDFDGIEGLVDTLGGIEVDVPIGFSAGGHTFTEGPQQMDGEQALAYVRERKQFAEGDIQRNRNQQAVLRAIVVKLISRDTLTDPNTLRSTVDAIAPYMTTDDGLGTGRMVELGLSLRSIRADDLYFMSVPYGAPFTTSGGAAVIGTDEEKMDELREALRTDETGTYYAQNAGTY
ncbi:MAG TPA: LCP family protein [Candidatus Brachybacterium merdigallinarum]|nr:LCP family protein [Candidatus Brachybacterium merdigallinarum]